MTPIKLTAIGFGETDFEYSFEKGMEQTAIQTGEDIKKYLTYALFGDETASQGEVVFEFKNGEKVYALKRDLATGDTTLTADGKKLSDKKCAEKLASLIRMDAKAYEAFLTGSKRVSYEGVTTDVNKFTEDFELKNGLNKARAEESANEYKEKIDEMKLKISALDEFVSDEKKLKKKLLDTETEIREIRKDSARLQEIITAGTIYASNYDRLKKAEEVLAEESKKQEEIDLCKAQIARSNELKEHFGLISAVSDVDEEIKNIESDLEEKESRLTSLTAEIAAGTKVLKKREESFLESTRRIKALNEAFDEMIKKNEEEGSTTTYACALAEENHVDEEGKTAELQEKVKVLTEEKKDVDAALIVKEGELRAKRQTAEQRKTIREGACFEITVENKAQYLDSMTKSLASDRLVLEKLQEEHNRNEEELAICENNYAAMFGSGTDSKTALSNLIRDYNGLERTKQSLYRNQILSATLLQDVNAIDKKIGENTDAKTGATENKAALESAKETLDKYVEKCKEAIDKKAEELSLVMAEKKFYEDLDNLEYGSRCPVCSAPVSDKTDAENKAKFLKKKEEGLKKELDRLYGIQKEYNEKEDKINVSLGSYESAIAANTRYIESLNATKTAKLSALKRIYEENNVQGHAELTAKLETVVADIARYGAKLSDLKGIVARREDCEKTLAVMAERIRDMEENVIPYKEEVIKELTDDVAKFQREYKNFAAKLGDKPALERLDETIKNELEEDELFKEVQELSERSDKLADEIDEAQKEIDERESVAYAFTDGKRYDRETARIKFAAERYEQVVGEIRKTEKEKQARQDAYIAVDGVLKDKIAQKEDLEREIRNLKSRKEIGESYLEKVRQSENYDDAVLKGKSYSEAKKEILDDEQYVELNKKIDEYEKTVASCRYEIDALKELNANSKDAFDALESNVTAAKELENILDEKTEESKKLANKLHLSEAVSAKIANIENELAYAKKCLSDVTAVSDGNASDLLIVKINNGLNELMPELQAKLKVNGLSVLYTDKAGLQKELDKLEDDQYATFALAVVVAEKQIVEETLNAKLCVRVIKIKNGAVSDELKAKLYEYAERNNVVPIFHR